MFSEKYVIRKLQFYWSRWLPELDRLSLSGKLKSHSKQIVQSCWADAMITSTPPVFNDLIGEMAFNGFARSIHNAKTELLTGKIIHEDIVQAIQKMALIRGGEIDKNAVTTAMLDDASQMSSRLLDFFRGVYKEVEINPRLRGFGRLASCYPDVIINHRLIELKSSRYRFKVEDFKQVFLYYFLAVHNGRAINQLELVNPRRGESVIMSVDDFCMIFAKESCSRTMSRLEADLM